MNYDDIDFLPTEEIANRVRNKTLKAARESEIADWLEDHGIELPAITLAQLFAQMPVLHEYDYRCYWCKYYHKSGEDPRDVELHKPDCAWAKIKKIMIAMVGEMPASMFPDEEEARGTV